MWKPSGLILAVALIACSGMLVGCDTNSENNAEMYNWDRTRYGPEGSPGAYQPEVPPGGTGNSQGIGDNNSGASNIGQGNSLNPAGTSSAGGAVGGGR